jgi:hypothetical protein
MQRLPLLVAIARERWAPEWALTSTVYSELGSNFCISLMLEPVVSSEL